MTVHVLAIDGKATSMNRLAAILGFEALGEEVRPFEDAAFDDIPLDRGDIVVGGIGYVRRAFGRLGLDVPH
ncbi:MAG: hypothetical protein ACPGID_13240, partial [Rubricella sp.]